MQQTVTHCTTLHHTAPHCITLQQTATHCNTLHHTAQHCTTLQHTATHYNTLQHNATNCNTMHHTAPHCNTLQHTTKNCTTLQHTAKHYNILQHIAPHRTTLHHTTTHSAMLQHTAPHCNTQQHTRTEETIQKNRTHMTKETYIHDKRNQHTFLWNIYNQRDLYMWEKRPMHITKERGREGNGGGVEGGEIERHTHHTHTPERRKTREDSRSCISLRHIAFPRAKNAREF